MDGGLTEAVSAVLIAGELRECADSHDVFDPWTGDRVGSVGVATWEHCDEACAAAQESLLHPIPIAERAAIALRVADAIREQKESLTDLLVREIGKPVAFARGEVERCERTFRLASEAGDTMHIHDSDLSYDPRGQNFKGTWQRFPVGVVLGFVPYNWPINLAAHKIAPAILAGCPVIMKLSPLAPLSTLALCQIVVESGAPKESISALHLSNELAQRLLLDSRVRMLSFTGSPAVGWMLKEMVPKKRVILELGGNAPAIVHEDADVEWAAKQIAVSGYGYAGQVCISAQNVFVHESVYERVRERLREETEQCPTGDPKDGGVVCGPLIDDKATAKVRGAIDAAVSTGGEIIAQAKVEGHARLIPPTLIEPGSSDDDIVREEVFGPVLTLQRYSDIGSLANWLNGGKYRLQASIFTQGPAVAQGAFESLDYGGVILNDAPTIRFDSMPYGGEGESGFGREGVKFAIEEMTAPRSYVRRI